MQHQHYSSMMLMPPPPLYPHDTLKTAILRRFNKMVKGAVVKGAVVKGAVVKGAVVKGEHISTIVLVNI